MTQNLVYDAQAVAVEVEVGLGKNNKFSCFCAFLDVRGFRLCLCFLCMMSQFKATEIVRIGAKHTNHTPFHSTKKYYDISAYFLYSKLSKLSSNLVCQSIE